MKAYAVTPTNALVGTFERRREAEDFARVVARSLNEPVEIKRLNVFGDTYVSIGLVAPAGGGQVERVQ